MPQDRRQALDFAIEASRGLPGSIKQVADLLLSEGTGIEQLSMAQVAARAYTSKPTLVRFAKQAGYAGWKDYRRDFLEAMEQVEAERRRQAHVDVNYPFAGGDTIQEIVSALSRIERLAASEVELSLESAPLVEAAQAILNARTCLCLGVMQNIHRNGIFASNLAAIGVACHSPIPEDAAPLLLQCLYEGDCIVATSYSGGLEHLPLSLVPQAKERGVTIVAVTNSERSPLADLADYPLTYPPLERYHAKVAAFYSGTCTSFVLDALFSACYAHRLEESEQKKRALLDSLTKHMASDFNRTL